VKRRNVAVLLHLSRPYDRQIMRGITEYVRSAGSWRLYVGEDPADKIPSLTAWSGDGCIIDLDDIRIAEAISHFRGPVVGIGSASSEVRESLGISTVRSNDELVGEWAADHFLNKGLRHFAYCGMRTRGLDMWVKLRRDAFSERVSAHGYKCSTFAGRYYATRNWNLMQGELERWLSGLSKPVGLMACNDSRGRHVLEACRGLKLRVPEDVAVLGVDNDELMCELAEPPLSSIALSTGKIGYEAAKLLDQLTRGRRRRQVHMTVEPACLITRQSSDLIAVDDPVVGRAVEFIRAHAVEVIGVSEIVDYVEVSRSTLETRFKRKLGRTVHDEIQRVRLDAARRMLTSSNISLQTIAERSGFRTAPYMCAVFKRELGKSPGQLRQQANSGGEA